MSNINQTKTINGFLDLENQNDTATIRLLACKYQTNLEEEIKYI